MTREEITAFFTRREDAWRAHDAAALAADHAPDAIVISPTGGVLKGREHIERIYRMWFTAFPDLARTDLDTLIDGDRAVHRNFDHIAAIACGMREALEHGDWKEAARLLREEWTNRKKNAPGITTPLIDRLVEVTRRAGSSRYAG